MKHFVLTRTITYHFTQATWAGAKRVVEKFTLEDADDTSDTLTCEETGQEEEL
jgi:hypothetical protein